MHLKNLKILTKQIFLVIFDLSSFYPSDRIIKNINVYMCVQFQGRSCNGFEKKVPKNQQFGKRL